MYNNVHIRFNAITYRHGCKNSRVNLRILMKYSLKGTFEKFKQLDHNIQICINNQYNNVHIRFNTITYMT